MKAYKWKQVFVCVYVCVVIPERDSGIILETNEETKRPVSKPIYVSMVGKWEKYEGLNWSCVSGERMSVQDSGYTKRENRLELLAELLNMGIRGELEVRNNGQVFG